MNQNILAVLLYVCATKYVSHGVFVDPQYKLVTWKGWGTSLTWFSDVLGGLDQAVQDEVLHALFSPDKLNLNVVRYTIGGTTPGDVSCGPFEAGAATESFRDGVDKLYEWSRDPRARKVLQAAKSLGADTFEAISFSPPSWLTKSNCTKGNTEGAPIYDNLDPKNANAFADYLTEVVKYYHEHYNITFSSLVPLYNHVASNPAGRNPSYEGCIMTRSTMLEVVKSAYASLHAKKLSFCSLAIADEMNFTAEIQTQNYFVDNGAVSLYTKVNTKTKNEGKLSEMFTISRANNHDLWMTENGWSWTSLQDMTQGLNLANRVILDLKNLLPSAWVYWQAFENSHTGTWGLLSIPFSNATVKNIQVNSGYYAMMQFSSYIRKGYQLISISDANSVAAFDESTNTLILVTVNPESSERTISYDLRLFSSLGTVDVFRTSPTEPHVAVPPPVIIDRQFDFVFPPRSITTFKIANAVSSLSDNLVKNGNFELSGTAPWKLLYGVRDDAGVNGKYVRLGNKSGFLDLAESKLALTQDITVGQTRTYYLSAWCASDEPSTILGVMVNGLQGPEVTVTPNKGYQLYGLSVDAEQNDVLTIYLHSDQGNYTAQIDDVVMH